MKIKYIFNLFLCAIFLLAENRFLLGDELDAIWDQYVEITIENLSKFPGWCSKEKAKVLMNFIYHTRPKICVEIGSFGGSTTYPIIAALSFTQRGFLYAIDAWDNQIAIEGLAPTDPNALWWNSLDMDTIYHQFVTAMLPFKQCHPLRQRSTEAVYRFPEESIDFLYIDGSFSSLGSFQDVTLYFPKIKQGGYIWINDADYYIKLDAISFLMENSCWIKKESIKNKCIVFQKSYKKRHN